MAARKQNADGPERDQKASDAVEEQKVSETPEKVEEPTAQHDGDDDAKSTAEVLEESENAVKADEVPGAQGAVRVRNARHETFEVPWKYLDNDDLERVRTSDSDDPNRSWTAQDAGEREGEEAVALVEVIGEPGQTFRVDELPDVSVMEANGVNASQWLAGVPVRADVEDEEPRKGIPA